MSVSVAGYNSAGLKSGGGQPDILGVFLHHAMRAEAPAEAAEAVFHVLHPALGRSAVIALGEQREDLLLQCLVETGGVALILASGVGVSSSVADGEAVAAIPCFGPPAIEDGAVECCVECRFLAAGA